MKKYLKIIIPIIIVLVIAFMAYKVVVKINHKKEIAENIKQMPEFSYLTLKEEVFTNKNLKKNTSTLFIYFNSECDFCNHEAEMIYENIKKLEDVEVVFISYESVDKISQFAQKYNLLKYDNINFLSDSKANFAVTFDINTLPCLVLYDKQNKLITKIKGQVKVETILQEFQNRD